MIAPFHAEADFASYATFSGGDKYIMQQVYNDAKFDPSTRGGIKEVLVGSVQDVSSGNLYILTNYKCSIISSI